MVTGDHMPREALQMPDQLANFQLTERDTEILECLTHKVRMFSLEQVGKTWWWGNKHGTSNAEKRLRVLEKQGLVEIFNVLSHPEIELKKPLVLWRSGLPQADFAKISYQLKQRWPNAHLNTPVVIATSKTATRFGGHGGRRPRRAEMTHDIHVSAVFLNFKSLRSKDAKLWVSEDEFNAHRDKQKGDKLPDAVLERSGGLYAIEFGGAYEKAKLEAFHAWCEKKQMPYEIW